MPKTFPDVSFVNALSQFGQSGARGMLISLQISRYFSENSSHIPDPAGATTGTSSS